MTLTTLLILNATLAAALVYGILWLLAHGIRSDRTATTHEADRRIATAQERNRLAA